MFTASEQILNLNWFIKSNYKQTSQIYLLAIKTTHKWATCSIGVFPAEKQGCSCLILLDMEKLIFTHVLQQCSTHWRFFSYYTTEVIWFSHLLNEMTPIYFRGMSYQGTNLIMLSQSNKLNMTKQSCLYFC